MEAKLTGDTIQLPRSDVNAQLLTDTVLIAATMYLAATLVSDWIRYDPLSMAMKAFMLFIIMFPSFRVWKVSRGMPRPTFRQHLTGSALGASVVFAFSWLFQFGAR